MEAQRSDKIPKGDIFMGYPLSSKSKTDFERSLKWHIRAIKNFRLYKEPLVYEKLIIIYTYGIKLNIFCKGCASNVIQDVMVFSCMVIRKKLQIYYSVIGYKL